MRGATQCAKRLKALFASLRSKLGKISPPAVGDPITQMILGILTRNVPESKAREALDRLRGEVVDYNELRVIPALELTEMLGEFPEGRLKCEDISRALNYVFAVNHLVSLDPVLSRPAKEITAFLEKIDGLEAYTRARVRLLGLQLHAVPLDEAMWAYAQQQEIVDPKCPLDEAQAFLERQIAAADGLEFFTLMRRQAWTDMGAAVRKGDVEPIRSIPPDRTTRNMLQMVGAGVDTAPLPEEDTSVEPDEPADEGEAAVEAESAEKAPANRKKSARAAKPAPAKATEAKSPAKVRRPRKSATATPKKTTKKPAKATAAKKSPRAKSA